MPFTWPPKDPDEVLDYDHDWKPRLAGDEIVTAHAEVAAGDVVIDSLDHLNGVQKLWLSGGTDKANCRLVLRVTTANGRVMDEGVNLKIRTR